MNKDRIRQRERIIYIDILRIFACFMVIVNHTTIQFLEEWGPGTTWFLVMIYFFLSKPAVPIFIMITGYTLLQRQESYRSILKRGVKMFGILLAVSVFFYVAERNQEAGFGIADFCGRFLRGEINFALWYMYLYFAILLMLPFLQKFVRGLEKKDFLVFFGISMAYFSVYPIVIKYIPALTISTDFQLPLFGSYICMLLLGYYFAVYMKRSKKGAVLAVIGLITSVLANVVLTYIDYQATNGTDYKYFDSRTTCFVMAEAICIFYLAGFIKQQKHIKWVSTLGKSTFGIYLIHMFFVKELEWLYIRVTGVSHILIGLLVYEIAVFLCSFAVVYAWEKGKRLVRRKT